jgi:Uma2 family endonuclease
MAAPAGLKVVLESGDRLTRAEFHRRYEARPDIKKAELVEGVVYVPSPVRFRAHGRPHGMIMGWISAYVARHPDLEFGDNGTVILDGDNEVQPDVVLWREEPGGPRVTDDDYVEGAPQLVVEIAASSASYDLHDKLRAYRRNGVQEYLIWRVLDAAFDWLRLHEGVYVPMEPDANGIIESEVFPGMRLDVPRLLAGDLAAVLAVLDTPVQ